ncbi:MAG: hypothetical protein J6P03_05685, partial [Opitutales bacterium]|nr:hypothetical protein [Opitutales bacterium]
RVQMRKHFPSRAQPSLPRVKGSAFAILFGKYQASHCASNACTNRIGGVATPPHNHREEAELPTSRAQPSPLKSVLEFSRKK